MLTGLSIAILAFVTAGIGAMMLTPPIARLAVRLGAVDHPDGDRKCQVQAVPRGGGFAIAIATILGLLAAYFVFTPAAGTFSTRMVSGLLPAAILLLIVGFIDDVWTLTGIYKLIGQMLAVSLLVAGGSQFESISLLGMNLPLGNLHIPFTIFFCLGAINAFNLVDGTDGLASSIGAIVSLTLGIIAISRGDFLSAMICFSLAGALTGFLRFNLSRASVYLGDTGSMLIGLVTAAVAIECSIKQQTAFALAVPAAICAIPALDAAAALVRRIITGQSVFTADRGHLHHALLLRGWSNGQTVAFIAGLTSLTCAAALASYFTHSDLIAVPITIAVFGTLAATRVFGHAESALIFNRLRSLVRSTIMGPIQRTSLESESTVRLQGNRKWQDLWSSLREAAPKYNVAGMTLQVSIPGFHESFFATWKQNDAKLGDDSWRVALPLTFGDRRIGKLTMLGASGGSQAVSELQQLFDYLEMLDPQIMEIIDEVAIPSSGANGRATVPSLRLAAAAGVSSATGADAD